MEIEIQNGVFAAPTQAERRAEPVNGIDNKILAFYYINNALYCCFIALKETRVVAIYLYNRMYFGTKNS